MLAASTQAGLACGDEENCVSSFDEVSDTLGKAAKFVGKTGASRRENRDLCSSGSIPFVFL